MRSLCVAVLAIVLAFELRAQDSSPPADEAARAAAGRRTEQVLRGLRTLELTEEQTGKIRALVLESELASEKQRAERTGAIEGVLDEAQKTRYRELLAQREERRGQNGPRNRGDGGREGGARGGMLRRMGLSADAIAEAVGASEEQKAKIAAMIEEWQAGLREALQGADRDQAREMLRTRMEELRGKIAGLLDDAQKAKLEAMGGGEGRRGGGEDARPRGDGEGRNVDPEQQVKRRLDEAMTALALPAEEAAVMSPLVEKLVRHNQTSVRELREKRERIAKMAAAADADPAALEGAVAEMAAAQARVTETREKLQAGLRELLTRTQELRLVGLGLLPPVAATPTTEPTDK